MGNEICRRLWLMHELGLRRHELDMLAPFLKPNVLEPHTVRRPCPASAFELPIVDQYRAAVSHGFDGRLHNHNNPFRRVLVGFGMSRRC
jgi:hypothetical protein